MRIFLCFLIILSNSAASAVDTNFKNELSRFCDREKKNNCSPGPKSPVGLTDLSAPVMMRSCSDYYRLNKCEDVKNKLPKNERSDLISCSKAELCQGEARLASATCIFDGVKAQFRFESLLSLGWGAAATVALGTTASATLVAALPFLILDASRSAEECDQNSQKKTIMIGLHNTLLLDSEKALVPDDKNLLHMPCLDLQKFLNTRLEVLVYKRQEKAFQLNQPVEVKSRAEKIFIQMQDENACFKKSVIVEKYCRTISAVVTGVAIGVAGVKGALAYKASKSLQSRSSIEKVIGKVSDEQVLAVEEAHLVGAGELGRDGSKAQVGNYSWPQLKEKAEVLRKSGLSPEQTRKLMEAKIVGIEEVKKKGFFSRLFGGEDDDIAVKIVPKQDPKVKMLSELNSGEASSGAVREFRDAYKLGHFDEKTQYLSYKPGGVGERYLVRAESISADGELLVIDAKGNRVLLNLDELKSARVSGSPDLIKEFQNQERSILVQALGTPAKDSASAEFRDRLSRGAFAAGSNQKDIESIISYVAPNGQRFPARVLEVLKDGRLKVRTTSMGEKALSVEEMASARMASAGSANNFVENEKLLISTAPATKISSEKAMTQFSKHIDQIAPKIDFKVPSGQKNGSYLSNGYWRQWMNAKAEAEIPDQGWKLHVGATPQSAQKIAESLIPELQKRGILHKVVDNIEKYAGMDPARDTQAGKFMTIYPRTDREAKEIAELVDGILKKQGLQEADFVAPAGEAMVRPGVYARYGRFTSADLKDSNGRTISRSGDLIRLPDGRLVPDERGITAPAGIRSPF